MAHGVCELLLLRIILKDLKIESGETLKLYYDNKFAISIVHNLVQNDRTKHIEVNKHFIKEKLDNGLITTPFMPTENHLADIQTKRLPPARF